MAAGFRIQCAQAGIYHGNIRRFVVFIFPFLRKKWKAVRAQFESLPLVGPQLRKSLHSLASAESRVIGIQYRYATPKMALLFCLALLSRVQINFLI